MAANLTSVAIDPSTNSKQIKKTIGDIVKIGKSFVIINSNNEGPITFGELAKANGEKDKISKASNKIFDPKYSMPRWCSLGLTHSQKPKLQRLREKENREKGAEKIFNDTHP